MRWGDYDDRAARLAAGFAARGLGRDAKVGMFMYNTPEYLVTQYAAFKERLTPVNVNYRYLDDELAYLLDNADCEAIVFHRSLGDRLARIRDRLPAARVVRSRRRRSCAGRCRGRRRRGVRRRARRPRAGAAPASAAPTTCTCSTPAAPPACRRA